MLKSWIKTADFCPPSLKGLSDKAFYEALSTLPACELRKLKQKAEVEGQARRRFKNQILPTAPESLKREYPHAFRTPEGRRLFILRLNGVNPRPVGFGNAPKAYHKAKGLVTQSPKTPRGFWGRDTQNRQPYAD